MSEPAITVKNLSKQYVLGGEVDKYTTFREMLAGLVGSPLHRLRKLQGRSARQETFWALKDISFDVQPGEVLGIIGRNGAGKSTLLKILSRITAPTTGEIQYRGRLASLLEVGTGFHPELSGRENIFINGAILGMARAEIRSKFDEIVDFAGIEQFLDTPVKRYSSGMYVRLAFAVAAHLDPDILVVDEVLAVGDAEFQKKCLGKMKDVSEQGRTVLLVSHNMATINALCQKCIVLRAGEFVGVGAAKKMVALYLNKTLAGNLYRSTRSCSGKPLIHSIQVKNHDDIGGEAFVKMKVEAICPVKCSIDFRLLDNLGTPVAYGSLGALDTSDMVMLQKGINIFELNIDLSSFANGKYFLSVDLTNPGFEDYDRVENALRLEVNRIARKEGIRILQQQWAKGVMELSIQKISKKRLGRPI